MKKKKTLRYTAISVLLILASHSAHGQDLANVHNAINPINQPLSEEQDWACKVLLCLADPRGPTKEKECRPPITRLWRHLIRHPFPVCHLAGNSNTGQGSFGRPVYSESNRWDLCPEGLHPITQTQLLTTATAQNSSNGRYAGNQQPARRGGYENIQYQVNAPIRTENDSKYGRNTYHDRACVGNLVRTAKVCTKSEYMRCVQTDTVYIYDKIIWQRPVGNGRSIDVYIDGKIVHKVFW